MAIRPIPWFSGAKLLALRVEAGLTQQELSDKTVGRRRVGRSTIGRYETGEATPSALNFAALVKALDCAPADLLDEPEAGAA